MQAIGYVLRALYVGGMRLFGSRAVTVGTGVYIGSHAFPSADEFTNVINASEGASKQWGNLIKAIALLFIVIFFRKPLMSLINSILKKIK